MIIVRSLCGLTCRVPRICALTIRMNYNKSKAGLARSNQAPTGMHYGRKGDILLKSDGGLTRTNALKHDGRYNQTMTHGHATRISAVVFSSPRTTAVMENPAAPFSLTRSFRQRLIQLPFFDINASLVNWSDGLVARTIQAQRDKIAAVITALDHS